MNKEMKKKDMLVTLNMTVSVGVCMGRASKTQQKRDLAAFLEKNLAGRPNFLSSGSVEAF